MSESIALLIPYLDKLADSIGNNGTYVFSLAVRQSYITGFIDLSYFILCAIFAILAVIFWQKVEKLPIGDFEHYVWAMVICTTISFVFGLVGVVKFEECITCFTNPEYNAIIQLLHTVK